MAARSRTARSTRSTTSRRTCGGQLDGDENITPIEAQDGSFTQLTINTGSGPVGNGHPALEDVRVRQAIAHAIDKEALVERVLNGLGTPGGSMSVAVAPKWNLDVPPDKLIDFDPAEANQILDDAGYTKGSDGIRRDAGRIRSAQVPLLLPVRRRRRTPGTRSSSRSGCSRHRHRRDGHAQERGRADADREQGSVRPRRLDLDAVRGPHRDDVVPHLRPGARRSRTTAATTTRSSATRSTTGCSTSRRSSSTSRPAWTWCTTALQRFYDQAPYVVLYEQDTIEAYRNDRFEGFVRQPARDRTDHLHPERPVLHADQAGLGSRRAARHRPRRRTSDSGGRLAPG